MRFADRRRSLRDLPPGPAALPEERFETPDPELVPTLVQLLDGHPAHCHHRLVRLQEELAPQGRGATFLETLLPLLDADPAFSEPPRAAASETPLDLELPVTSSFDGHAPKEVGRVLTAVCEALHHPVQRGVPCHSVSVLIRVRRELSDCGHYWVACGALGLGLPLAWASFCRSLARGMDASVREFPAELGETLRELAARERARVASNLELLAPALHEPYVRGPLELGARRLLDGWRIMLNGLDRRVFGGLREL